MTEEERQYLWNLYITEPDGRFRDLSHFKRYYKYRYLYKHCNIAFRLFFKTVIAKGNNNEKE